MSYIVPDLLRPKAAIPFPLESHQYLLDVGHEKLSFFIEQAFKVKEVNDPVRLFLFFSFIIINLFWKSVRNFHRFYSFICESKFVFDV